MKLPAVSEAHISATALVAVAGIESFRSFLPALADVRNAAPGDPGMASAVNTGEAMSVATIALLALTVASMTGTARPLYVGLAAVAVMHFGYQHALRSEPAV